MSDRRLQLTREQEKIVGHEGAAFVAACPGAGKTRVMVERAALLMRAGHTVRGVAFLSFTNAAVAELETRLRVAQILPSPIFPHFLGTFDSFLWQFLVAPFGIPGCRIAPRLVPDKNKKGVRPWPDARELPLEYFDQTTCKFIPEKAIRSGFDTAKSARTTQAYETAARRVRENFKDRGELDFDDARLLVEQRLSDSHFASRLKSALHARFREVIVDEAQDCNPADLEIIDWFRKAGIVVKVICDPHQSIYGFRGGVTEQIFSFQESFSESDRLPMTGNFRSNGHICNAIVALRDRRFRQSIDQPLGKHRNDDTSIRILAYQGTKVTKAIGAKFGETALSLGLRLEDCPVLAATKQSGANAVGQPLNEGSKHLTIRLANAVMDFHYAVDSRGRGSAIESVHSIILNIQGKLDQKTYWQHVRSEAISPDSWRSEIIHIIRELRYGSGSINDCDRWLEKARELLSPYVPAEARSIKQLLQAKQELSSSLVAPEVSGLASRTIHSVKGMQFPGVCVVMTSTAKSIIDYLESGVADDETKEAAREIYVAASRAERLLVFAVPSSQASRLCAHLGYFGSCAELIWI